MSAALTLGWQLVRYALFVGVGLLLLTNTNFVLFDLGWNFSYLGFLLFLPIETPVVVLLAVGFGLGLTMDIFLDTGGLYAAAAVLVAYLRPWVLRLLTPRDGYAAADAVNVHQMGWQWLLVYLALLVSVHCAALFLLELGSFRMPGFTLLKILVSTVYTVLTLFILQLNFFSTKRKRQS